MNIIQSLGGVIGGAVLFLLFLLGFFLLVRTFFRICMPNEALVFSGGFRRGSEIVTGGRKLYIPFFMRVSRLPLTLFEVPIQVRNSYSSGGIAMNIDAIANVKVSSDQAVLRNAVERFLDQDINTIRRVAKETLEGHLRGVIANLTPEQVNEDRLKFADGLTSESESDLRKLGLHLDTLKILHVSDDVGYLDATGRKAIAHVVREAEIAESDANRTAELVEAENRGRGEVTAAEMDTKIIGLRNELRKMKADFESAVNAEEERTAAAAREARAVAEQRLQEIRARRNPTGGGPSPARRSRAASRRVPSPGRSRHYPRTWSRGLGIACYFGRGLARSRRRCHADRADRGHREAPAFGGGGCAKTAGREPLRH
jgi:flotillin